MEFKIGQVFQWRGKGIFGRLINLQNIIMFGERGPTHCGVISSVDKDTVIIHEATKNGFVSNTYEKSFILERINAGVVSIQETKVELHDVKKHCKKYEGIKYGFFTILVIAVRTLFDREIVFTDGAKTLICSEGVSRVLYDCSDKQIDFEKEFEIPFDLICPMNIYKSIQMTIIA